MRMIREIFRTTFTDPAVAITLTFKNIFCPSEGANLVQHKIVREYEYSFYILSPQMFSEITLVTKQKEMKFDLFQKFYSIRPK